MKGCLIFLIFIQSITFYSVSAQISDDFSDGNFTNKPAWYGDTSEFIINTENQLQLNGPRTSGYSCIYIISEVIKTVEWDFYVRLDFNPSSSNYIDVYLVSDAEALSGPVNGYFVRVEDTKDEVCLYKQSGDKSSAEKIIDGLDDRVALSMVELNIRVTRSSENE